MFYISKIVWPFVQPSTLIAILLVAGCLLLLRGKRMGAPVLFIGAAFYLIAGFSPLANWLLFSLESRAKIGTDRPIEGAAAIIVLGGAQANARDDRERRPVLNEAADRMVEAVRLARLHPEIPVIFSGGSGNLFGDRETEAALAKRFFADFDIAPPRLRLEDRSRNTLENAIYTAQLVKPKPEQRFVLITSAFHMPRAVALFEAQGFDIIPHPADFRLGGRRDLWTLFAKPSDGLARLDLVAKECAGLWVSWLRGDIGVRERVSASS